MFSCNEPSDSPGQIKPALSAANCVNITPYNYYQGSGKPSSVPTLQHSKREGREREERA